MNKLKQILFNNQTNIKYTSVITLFFLLIFSILYAHMGHPIIDCGREAYIPSAILDGKVLYKDIFNTYGPLAFQINAIWYTILGKSLNSLYIAGGINSLIIILTLYVLMKNFAEKKTSLHASLLIMTSCVFSPWIFNYIFPYSYSVTYALSSFLLSVLFLVKYIKANNIRDAYLSALFIGASITFKQEYGLFLIVLYSVFLYLKPLVKKDLIKATFAILFIPIISWGILFIQGLNFTDIINTIKQIDLMSKTQSLKFFYSNLVGFFYNQNAITTNLVSLVVSIINYILCVWILYFSWIKLENKNKFIKNSIIFVLAIILLLTLIPINTNNLSYSWIPLSTLCISIFSIYSYCKNKNESNLLFLVLSTSAVISTIKSFFLLNLNVYGTLMLPLALITNIIFVAEYIPQFCPKIDKKIWMQCISIILLLTTFVFLSKNIFITKNMNNYQLQTKKGRIYTNQDTGKTIDKTLKYLEKNSKKTDTVLVIPEGVMINFMSDRKSDDMYYFLIPVNVELFGEDKIIKDLTIKKPDYIVLNNRDTSDYNAQYFGKDYGKKVYDFIIKNYKFKESFGDGFVIEIYKK